MHAFHSCCQKKAPLLMLCVCFVCFVMVFFHCSRRSKCKEPYQRCFLFFLQLAKMNVEAQQVERELRDELANSISKAASDADRSRITELEKVEAELRVEVSRHV